MRKDLIEDLRNGFDNTPEDAPRELERLAALNEEAALAIEQLSNKCSYMDEDPYRVLSKINVNDHTEKKNGLTYLSWAWAWDTLLSLYPDSYTSIHRPTENDFPYWTDGKTCWVDVAVTVVWEDRERERHEIFPIMDYKNRSIPADKVTSFDVNTALQRAWTKCIARHGLGFYIYAGQDLPNEEAEAKKARETSPITPEQTTRVQELYSTDEIVTMLRRLKKDALFDVTQAQADKMIAKRDQSLLQSAEETF